MLLQDLDLFGAMWKMGIKSERSDLMDLQGGRYELLSEKRWWL